MGGLFSIFGERSGNDTKMFLIQSTESREILPYEMRTESPTSSHPEIGPCALGSRYNHCVRRARGRTGRATDAEQKLGRSSSRAHQRSDGHTWCGGNGSGIVQRITLHQGVHSWEFR